MKFIATVSEFQWKKNSVNHPSPIPLGEHTGNSSTKGKLSSVLDTLTITILHNTNVLWSVTLSRNCMLLRMQKARNRKIFTATTTFRWFAHLSWSPLFCYWTSSHSSCTFCPWADGIVKVNKTAIWNVAPTST